MIASEREDTSTCTGMRVDLICQFARHGRDGEGVLHPAVVGVGSREEVFVGVDGVIMVEFVAQFGLELREEAARDQRRGSCVYSGFALRVLEVLRKARRGSDVLDLQRIQQRQHRARRRFGGTLVEPLK